VEASMSDRFKGGCACGDVRYRLTSEPMFVNCCHCSNCQTQTGSAFVINALIETARIETSAGDLEITTVASGDDGIHDIYRCPTCKTAVWSDYGRRPGLRFVRVGTLDEPAELPPRVHVFSRSKLPWIRLPEQVPQFDEYFDLKELWPAESLERLRAST
jgi:hypothetical protein